MFREVGTEQNLSVLVVMPIVLQDLVHKELAKHGQDQV